ncbi:MAG: hypothetical protein QM734_09780 [Cyclobacteriaceae bacterium]
MKFKLSFTPVGSSSSKVIEVNVTSYTAANDSTFIPPPSSGTDSIGVQAALQGTYSCVFTYSQVNYTSPGDTTKVIDQNLNIKFDGETFSSLDPPALPLFIPGGEGTFFFSSSSPCLINFINTREFPQGAPSPYILNGQWNIIVFDTYIMIWKTDTFTSSENITIEEFGSFKINR